jgi:hypothetical protein
MAGEARQDEARLGCGMAGQGLAGQAWRGSAGRRRIRSGGAVHGSAGQGQARQARRGKVGPGRGTPDKAWQAWLGRRVSVRHGSPWHSGVWPGAA